MEAKVVKEATILPTMVKLTGRRQGNLLYMSFFFAVAISTSNIVHVLVCGCAFIVLLLFCFFILKFSFMLLCGISPSALRGLFKNSGVIYLVAVRSCCTCCSVLHKLTSSQQYDTLDCNEMYCAVLFCYCYCFVSFVCCQLSI